MGVHNASFLYGHPLVSLWLFFLPFFLWLKEKGGIIKESYGIGSNIL